MCDCVCPAQVIIKQEPGELPQQAAVPAAGAAQPSLQQYVTVKGSHMLALSPQKPAGSGGEGTVQPKVRAPGHLWGAGSWLCVLQPLVPLQGCWCRAPGWQRHGWLGAVCRVAPVLLPCSAGEGSRLSRHCCFLLCPGTSPPSVQAIAAVGCRCFWAAISHSC